MVAEERNLSPNLLNLSSHLIQSQGERAMNLSLTLEQEDVFHVTPDLPDWVSKKHGYNGSVENIKTQQKSFNIETVLS